MLYLSIMNILEQYPSTDDLPPIKGGQDPVLAILQGARRRYRKGGTSNVYLGRGGAVCAVGAVAREAGLTPGAYDRVEDVYGEALGGRNGAFTKVLRLAEIEADTRVAAKKAITLLNQSARRLYPQSKIQIAWSGPIEWLNQAYGWPEAKEAVLACYDDAIERRIASGA